MTGRLSVRGLLFSILVVGMGCAVNVILHHDPVLTAWSLKAPQAAARDLIPLAEPSVVVPFDLTSLGVPEGYRPHWKALDLDGGRMQLSVLETPFKIQQTRNGSEYYAYVAGLMHQMAFNVSKDKPDSPLVSDLQGLSMSAQHMGYGVESAWHARFEGVPRSDMQHIQVHDALSQSLEALNPQGMIKLDYNQDGALVAHEQAQAASTREGTSLAEFHRKLAAVMAHPDSKRYPQAMAALKRQAALLDSLSHHLSMRYENTLYCGAGNHRTGCDGRAMYVRLYVTQTLKDAEIAAALR